MNKQERQAALDTLRGDPAAFRRALIVDTDAGPRRLADVMDDWQRKDYEALDDSWRRVVGQDVKPKYMRGIFERPRGHDKTSSLAVMVLWALFAASRKIDGAAFAADKEQAGLLRNAIDRLLRLNPWLSEFIECNKFFVVNKLTGSTLVISSSDVATSWGMLLHFVVLDEGSHWRDRDLFDSVLSTVAKRENCLMVMIQNAGYMDHWMWGVREAIRNDPNWYFSRLDGICASWLLANPKIIDEQRRLLPAKVFDRLWMNNWQESSDSALNQSDVLACCVLAGPMPRRLDRFSLASLDIGVKRDFTGFSVLYADVANHCVEVANGWQLRPQDYNGRIDADSVRKMIFDAYETYRFPSIMYDPSQAYFLMDDVRKLGIGTIECSFTPANRDLMARTLIESLQTRTLKFFRHEGLLRDFSKLRVAEAPHLGLRLEAPRDEVGGHADLGFSVVQALPLMQEIARNGVPNYSGGSSHSDFVAETLVPV